MTRSKVQEQSGSFLVEVVNDTIHVAWFKSDGTEAFRVLILKNGGISEIRITRLTDATTAGWFVWNDDWAQTTGTNETAEPIIQEMSDYVSLTCQGKYSNHTLSTITKITITKTGIILISTSLTAYEDALDLMMIAWGLWGFPVNVFAGTNASIYAPANATIEHAYLPYLYIVNATAPFSTNQLVPWMDFSTGLEGITVVNLIPQSFVSYGIGDERQWNGTTFSVQFRNTDWGQSLDRGAMKKGDVKVAKIALCIHGPGGYKSISDTVDLLTRLGRVEGKAYDAGKTFKDSNARNLASQASATIDSALLKISVSDITGAKNDCNQALALVNQAAQAETLALMIRDFAVVGLPVIGVIVVLIFLRMRKKR